MVADLSNAFESVKFLRDLAHLIAYLGKALFKLTDPLATLGVLNRLLGNLKPLLANLHSRLQRLESGLNPVLTFNLSIVESSSIYLGNTKVEVVLVFIRAVSRIYGHFIRIDYELCELFIKGYI